MPPQVIRTLQTGQRQQWDQKYLFATLFLLFILVSKLYLATLPPLLRNTIINYFIIINFFTGIRLWQDKSNAMARTWRIRDSHLHALESMGGWPVSFLVQRKLRHKTWKRSYQLAFWGAVGFNLSLCLSLAGAWWGLWLSWRSFSKRSAA